MVARKPFSWLNDVSRKFLGVDYLLTGTTPENRVANVGAAAEKRLGIAGFADRFFDYMSRGWYSLASPVWSNYGLTRGLPISCFGSMCEDSLESIIKTRNEISMMSKYGGGTSVYLGRLRGRGTPIKDNGTSSGAVHFAELFDKEIQIVSQGSSRRGQCAMYINIDHPDIEEALRIRTVGHPIQHLSYGVCVTDAWLDAMIAGDERKRAVWAKVIESRKTTGYPYLFFHDNANRQAPAEYASLGKTIRHSNLCNEIMLADDEDESFVCCLSSMNLLYFEEWKDTDAVETMVYFLDTVLSEFIEKADGVYGFDRAVRFAARQRALGMGILGWHSFLQSKMIPFESNEAKRYNALAARTLRDQGFAASRKMAAEFGKPLYLKDSDRRHMTLSAIAPTQSSSTILEQVSEGVEPEVANYAVKDKQKVKYTKRNKYLGPVLARYGLDTEATWDGILKNGGSVQHIKELTDHERAVFKTFIEIAPMEVITQAAQRQPYICQGQSLNLRLDPALGARDRNRLLLEAWRLGLKGLYYEKAENAAQQLSRDILACSSCEG